MAYLEYYVEGTRHERELGAEATTIGRANGCSIQLLHDGELSRVHCSVRAVEDTTYVVQDEESRNGTLLNGVAVPAEPTPLHEGDRIRIGKTVLTFREQEVGRTSILLGQVEQQMREGKGFHTIMNDIVKSKPKGPS